MTRRNDAACAVVGVLLPVMLYAAAAGYHWTAAVWIALVAGCMGWEWFNKIRGVK